jgi:magnesium-transporting ATPase (P-type)
MSLPAAELVSGDVVKLSLGGVVAADVTLLTEKFFSINPC